MYETIPQKLTLGTIDDLTEEEEIERQKYIQEIEKYLAQQKVELLKQEEELEALIFVVTSMRANISMHTRLLAKLKRGQVSPSSDATTFINAISGKHRSPTEMLRPKYKGMKLADVVVEVLGESQSLLTTTEIGRKIYDTTSDDEFNRARNSLSTELRTGAKAINPKWKKIGRYAYVAL